MLFQKITTNFTGVVRNDTMEGRDYLVAAMVMLVEGVHEGSNGPLYYPADELSKTPVVWNHKPVVVYHPEANGQGVSACDPDILTNRKVGVIMNTSIGDIEVEVNGVKKTLVGLKAEAWLEIDRMNKVDERIAEAIENKEVMELSTGVFTDNDGVPGEWNGEAYTSTARNYRPDHLALLPDLKGACSIEDGAGFLRLNEAKDAVTIDVSSMSDKERKYILADENGILEVIGHNLAKILSNEISFDDTRQRLQSIVRAKFGEDDYIWIEDVFDDYFVYERAGNLYKQVYDIVNGSLSFTGLPIVVTKETNYVTVNEKTQLVKNERKRTMDKQKMVDALIKNEGTEWGDDDKDTLMALDEDVLKKMTPVVNEEEDDNKDEDNKDEDNKDDAEEEAVENMTAEDYIAKKVPAELKGVLRNGLNSYNANKAKLVTVIMANKRNKFAKEHLEAKDLDELKSLAALAADSKEQAEHLEVLDYTGQGEAASQQNAETPLELPVINFEEAKAKAS